MTRLAPPDVTAWRMAKFSAVLVAIQFAALGGIHLGYQQVGLVVISAASMVLGAATIAAYHLRA
jgi:hypothetical protein